MLPLEWSKIKNIILLMLLGVNAFLLVLVSVREWRSAQYAERARDEVISILAENSIRLDGSILPEDTTLPTLAVSRDAEAETRQAQALLGELDPNAEGSVYRGQRGSARFYLDGELTAEFLPGAYPGGEDPAAAVQAILSALEMQGQVGSVTDSALTVQQSWNGVPIFNCRMVVALRDGDLWAIAADSRRLNGTPQPEAGPETMTVATALMRFLDHIKTSGDICSAITGVTAGYLFESQNDPGHLIPAWRISAEAGAEVHTYYINAQTGEVRSES